MFYLLKNRRKFQYRKSPNTKIAPPSYLKILVIYLGPLNNLKLCINTCSSLIMCSSSFVDNSNLHLHTIIKCKLFCLKTLCNFLKNSGYACPSFLGLFLLSTSFRLPFLVFLYFALSFLSPTLCCKRIILCLYVQPYLFVLIPFNIIFLHFISLIFRTFDLISFLMMFFFVPSPSLKRTCLYHHVHAQTFLVHSHDFH